MSLALISAMIGGQRVLFLKRELCRTLLVSNDVYKLTKFLEMWSSTPYFQVSKISSNHVLLMGSSDGVVVITLASHLRGPGSGHEWIKLVVGSLLCSERFF